MKIPGNGSPGWEILYLGVGLNQAAETGELRLPEQDNDYDYVAFILPPLQNCCS